MNLPTYLLTYLFIYPMEQSQSCEANLFSASQEFPQILCNPSVHYLIQKCRKPFYIVSHLDPVHTTTYQFLKVHFNIILTSKLRSPQWFLFLRFRH